MSSFCGKPYWLRNCWNLLNVGDTTFGSRIRRLATVGSLALSAEVSGFVVTE